MDAVVAIGEQLVDHPDWIGPVTAIGLDETLFARRGPFRRQSWSTQIDDVRRGHLLDVVPGRDPAGACRWLEARPQPWLAAIDWATLVLSASYRSVCDMTLPDAVQIADTFHVVKLANPCRVEVTDRELDRTDLPSTPTPTTTRLPHTL